MWSNGCWLRVFEMDGWFGKQGIRGRDIWRASHAWNEVDGAGSALQAWCCCLVVAPPQGTIPYSARP